MLDNAPIPSPPQPERSAILNEIGACSGFMVDLDGTLIDAAGPRPGARRFVERYGDRLLVLSNNSTDTPESLSRRLRGFDLPIPADRLLLAGCFAVDVVAKDRPGACLQLIGTETLLAYALARGLSCAGAAAAEIVLVARDPLLTYAKLAAAANAIRLGARFYATNPDATHPGPAGTLVPETGALTAAVAMAAGRLPDHVFGKPDATFVAEGLRRLGSGRARTLVIGDNPDTDGRGAAALGLGFVHIGGPDRTGLLQLLG
jgi:HAD superfamily hydrolase (TIGR01450 family)